MDALFHKGMGRFRGKPRRAPRKVRRYDLDWLRVLGVLLLVPFHVALVFNLDPNSVVYLKDTVHRGLLLSGLFTGLEGGVTPAHLWFILFLFVYALVALPLFTWLRSPPGRKVTANAMHFLARPFAPLMLLVPLALAEIVLVSTWVCLGLYEAIKRVDVLRFLMGMKSASY